MKYEFTHSGRHIVCTVRPRTRVPTLEPVTPPGVRTWHVSVNGGTVVDSGIGAAGVDLKDPRTSARLEHAVVRFIAHEMWKNQG